MSVRIDAGRCVRCGACAEICPGNLIRFRQGKAAFLPHPEECWGCASCLKACRAGAITYYLGADIGGRGAGMRVVQEGRFSRWIITLPERTARRSGPPKHYRESDNREGTQELLSCLAAQSSGGRSRGKISENRKNSKDPENPEISVEAERIVTITVDRNDANKY